MAKPPASNYSQLEIFIRQYCNQHRIPLETLAKKANIAKGTLYDLMKPSSDLKISHLVQIAHALQVHPFTLLELKWADFDYLNLPSPSNQAEPASNDYEGNEYDASGFVDETVPDGSIVAAGCDFIKTWTIQNLGKVTWQQRFLLCMDEMSYLKYPCGSLASEHCLIPHQIMVPIEETFPNQITTISVTFKAPLYAGRYISYWKMVDQDQQVLFPNAIGLSVSVLVKRLGFSNSRQHVSSNK